MPASDFEEYISGFELTSANYSGGAGGTFSNLVAGEDGWSVDGATPSFSMKSGLEGMDFTGLSGESILSQLPMYWGGTVMMVCEIGSASNMYPLGGNHPGANTWGINVNSNTAQAYRVNHPSGFTNPLAVEPHVLTASFSPMNGINYIQADEEGVIMSGVGDPQSLAAVNDPRVSIGRHRVGYFTGWIHRIFFFARPLHYSKPTELAALISEEVARL